MSRDLVVALDETLADDVSHAVVAALRSTFDVEVVPGKFEIGRGMVALVGDVSGVIGMVQDELEGTLTLCFNYETMRAILPKVLGQSIAVTHEMAVDAVGEITNMIFGYLKTALNRRGHDLKLGIPSVVTGKGHFLGHFHRGRYMIVPFTLQGHVFQLHVAIHKASAAEEAE